MRRSSRLGAVPALLAVATISVTLAAPAGASPAPEPSSKTVTINDGNHDMREGADFAAAPDRLKRAPEVRSVAASYAAKAERVTVAYRMAEVISAKPTEDFVQFGRFDARMDNGGGLVFTSWSTDRRPTLVLVEDGIYTEVCNGPRVKHRFSTRTDTITASFPVSCLPRKVTRLTKMFGRGSSYFYNDGGGHVGSDVFRAKKRATLRVR